MRHARPFAVILLSTLVLISAPILVAAATPTVAPPSRQADAPPACDDLDGFHELDFWVGEWNVYSPDDRLQGRNRIEKVLGGCAVVESWTATGGGEGRSLFYYNRFTDTWKQVWVTGLATVPGGVKEKTLVERLDGGAVRFQGQIVRPDGSTYLDRTTLTPLEDGRVEQRIQVSMDDGETWTDGWVGYYVRRDPSPGR